MTAPSPLQARHPFAPSAAAAAQLLVWLLLLLSLGVLSGCALPPHPRGPAEGETGDFWSGRLALQVEEEAAQSFSALFELRGNEQQGELALSSPLGNRLGQLSWKNGHAQLISGQETRSSDSLDLLLQDMTGTRLPVAALFQWLHGIHTPVPGWEADLSAIGQGRLVARRDHPKPQVVLRIALSRS